jgi:hypothetical protein
VYNIGMAEWCTVTVIDPDGRRHSLDVLAEGTYDAAHLFFSRPAGESISGFSRKTTKGSTN